MNLEKSKVCLPDKLPCQEVPHHPKTNNRPVLAPNFKVVEEHNILDIVDPVSALTAASNRQFLISFIRCGLPKDNNETGRLPRGAALMLWYLLLLCP